MNILRDPIIKENIREVYDTTRLVIESVGGTTLTPKLCKRAAYSRPPFPSIYVLNISNVKIKVEKNKSFNIYISNVSGKLMDDVDSPIVKEMERSWEPTNIDLIHRHKEFSTDGKSSTFVHCTLYYLTNDPLLANNGYLEKGIDKFTSPETFDTFKDLYNFSKL
jgi:hypothetical protein